MSHENDFVCAWMHEQSQKRNSAANKGCHLWGTEFGATMMTERNVENQGWLTSSFVWIYEENILL